MRQVLQGATAMGGLVIGVFFFRFYRQSRDTLFALFGAAFWLLAVNNIALGLTDASAESRVYIYMLRLVAFLLIIVAIVQKNRSPS
jgi:uncharacterized membrane protein HdeD (DUF308 family)